MANIKNDPERLFDYARFLAAHGRAFHAGIGDLAAHMKRLGASWRDDQFVEFETETRALDRSLAEYEQSIAGVVRSLDADVEALRRVRNVRGS